MVLTVPQKACESVQPESPINEVHSKKFTRSSTPEKKSSNA